MNQRGLRVLIMEPSVDDVRRMSAILQALPDIAIVGIASTPGEARAMMEPLQPSVVLMNMIEDEAGRLSLLEFIKDRQPSCVSIVLTEQNSRVTPRQAFAFGANFVIQKSIGLDDLPEILRQCAQKQSVFAL